MESNKSSDGFDDRSEESNFDDANDLETFRAKWQKELFKKSNKNEAKSSGVETSTSNYQVEENDLEQKAQSLFLKGVDLEKCGQLYDAIKFYRKAIQMVPDIEFKMRNFYKAIEDKENGNKAFNKKGDKDLKNVCKVKDGDLIRKIQRKTEFQNSICVANFDQTALHISSLPTEIILYILRWIISTDLDLRSLELFSQVCRGFYLCARDTELWKSACLKVWGVHCGKSPDPYSSWRNMFIERPRILFNGCYISKTTYIRPGENSFQDEFYRPWHLVAYYRYIRFFPEGKVLILTSADEPMHSVNQLKRRNAKTPVLSGYYRLKDDKVILMVQRQEQPKNTFSNKKNKNKEEEFKKSQTFQMELQIMNYKKRKHVLLKWTYYSIRTINLKGEETVCSFDVICNKFPPLWYSRVKSYTLESETPLT